MQKGMAYVFYDTDVLFAYGMPCNDPGSTAHLYETVARGTYYKIIGGKLYKIREGYYVSRGNDEYIVHCWGDNGSYFLDYNTMLLPACLFVIVFFSCIWHWFIRLRG